MEDYDYIFKILLVGDSGVGKSSILNRFCDDNFDSNFNATVGVDCRMKKFNSDDKEIKLQLWEIVGQKRFISIASCYYPIAQAYILVFDITDRETFENIPMWIENIEKEEKTRLISVPKILVGNKSDLTNRRHVSYEEAVEFAHKMNSEYIEISVKENEKINSVFEKICKQIRVDNTGNMEIFQKGYKRSKGKRVGNLYCCGRDYDACCII